MEYIHNLETGKIELHFDKADYLALSDDQKRELKSAFLFSGKLGAWVSRSVNNHYWAKQIANKLGFDTEVKQGERLSYAEQLEVKAERAEARAERYETYSANAEKRAEALQKPINDMRGDIAFFTQPIIAGHAGSQAFARRRQRMYEKYERGIAEYRKSSYYQDRAETARATAANEKLKDRVYLHNKIKESNKALKELQGRIVTVETNIYKLQQGEQLKNWKGDPLTLEGQEERLEEILNNYEWEQDKLTFFEDCLELLGGVQFSKENIKVGYIVDMERWGKSEILSAGPLNVTFVPYPFKQGYCPLTEPYAAIKSVIAEKIAEKPSNPFAIGDIVCKCRPADNSVYKAYQVVKTTETGCKLQPIKVTDGKPEKDNFLSDVAQFRKVVKSKYSDWVGMYDDDWQLNKYNG